MKKIFIDGKAGTTGLRIYERLENRNDIEIITLSEELRKDPDARKQAINSADVVFLCLPDAASIEAVAMVENENTVIIDTSTAHRTNPQWAYGFPELSDEFEDKINFIAENFGREYITNETIGRSITELQAKLLYLKSRGILYGVVTDPLILRLSPEQIEERIKVLKLLGRPLVVRDKKTNKEKLSFIFSAKPTEYQEMIGSNNIDLSALDEQLARKFNQENTD